MVSVLGRLLDRLRSLVPRGATTRFAQADADRDGTVTYEEFDAAFRRRHGRSPNKDDVWAFLAHDRNGDAAVSLREYANARR